MTIELNQFIGQGIGLRRGVLSKRKSSALSHASDDKQFRTSLSATAVDSAWKLEAACAESADLNLKCNTLENWAPRLIEVPSSRTYNPNC